MLLTKLLKIQKMSTLLSYLNGHFSFRLISVGSLYDILERKDVT